VSTATPSAQPSGTAFTPAQVIAALGSVQQHWNTLTLGSNPEAAIASLVAWIKTQPSFKDAGEEPGAVWATLADGQPAIFYVDRLADYAVAAPAARRVSPTRPMVPLARARALRQDAGPTSGQVLFLVNALDTVAFTPSRQADFAIAFANAGYPGVLSASSVTLENIVAAGSKPTAYFDIATHGGNGFNVYAQRDLYTLSSDTAVTADNYYQYHPEIRAAHLEYSLALLDPDTDRNLPQSIPVYAFTSAWLTQHMKFAPGAVFVNTSCFGANVYPAGKAFVSDLNAAGVGFYAGWTKSVDDLDADETDAYLIDRLLGEQIPSLNDLPKYVLQDSPPERPFQVNDILLELPKKPRDNPIRNGSDLTYDLDTSTQPKDLDTNSSKQPIADGASAKFTYIGYGTAQVVPLVPPTIAFVNVDEAAAPEPTLTISGEFSQAEGDAYITESNLPAAVALPILSWSPEQITVQLPPSAPQSGNIVVGELGVPSNLVPLTKWSGVYSLTRNYALSGDGSGSFSYSSTLNVDLRGDVHFWYQSVDGEIQVLDFEAVPMRSSTGTMTAKSGSYAGTASGGSEPPLMTTFASKGAVTLTPTATITATNGTLDNYFGIQASAMDSAAGPGCNRGSAFDFGDPDFAHYCTSIQAAASDIATCSDNRQGSSCQGNAANALPMYGTFDTVGMYGSDAVASFELELTPDYAIDVHFSPPQDPNADGVFLGSFPSVATTTWSATFGSPSFPPTGNTPALRARLAARAR